MAVKHSHLDKNKVGVNFFHQTAQGYMINEAQFPIMVQDITGKLNEPTKNNISKTRTIYLTNFKETDVGLSLPWLNG